MIHDTKPTGQHNPAPGEPLPLGEQLQAILLATFLGRRRGTSPSAQLPDAIELIRSRWSEGDQ